MSRLRTFLALSSCERGLAIRAAVLVWLVRLGLWVAPFKTVRRWLTSVPRARAPRGRDRALDAERVGWAVNSASRYVPAATCLVRALAADRLLFELGLPSELRLGVAKDPYGRLEAHAWVESGARVVVGGHDVERFRVLLPSDQARPRL